MNILSRRVVFFLCWFVVIGSLKGCGSPSHSFESLPVQESGRLKPMVTLAQEMLQLIHGKSRFKGKPALEILTTWMLIPEPWLQKEFIRVDHHGLKEALGFPKEKKYFSPQELTSHQRLSVLFGDLQTRVQRKEKLNAYYQAVSRLQTQLVTFHALSKGGLRVFPPGEKDKSDYWKSLEQMEKNQAEAFFKILAAYATQFIGHGVDREKGEKELEKALAHFRQMASQVGGARYPSSRDMATEVHYQKLKPFFWTWILYLLSVLLFSFSFLGFPKHLSGGGSLAFVLAFAMHTYGFILRCLITHRPPVSNMYETVVWVGWGVVLLAGILAYIRQTKWIALVGGVVATLCMVVADFAPVVLDSTLQPLEPVLRSNLWLTIHVMTITLSYAAFFLAFGIGDYGVFLHLKDGQAYQKKVGELAQVAYRCIQVGVVLLTAGTILGGVWADYSWGRFWGWDPKETWAFIALMGYLALLHARLVGLVKDFGMLAGSVLSFSLVIMAWYGVNFVLGAGLHSYGFGAGGVEYVSGFVGLHILYVAYAWGITSLARISRQV